MSFPPVNEQIDLIKRGAAEIIPEEELEKKVQKSLRNKKPLQVKLGCDPSRPDLHLGHAVVLRKLRHFQDLGHQAILVVGDFTGMIGDPSGRNKTRPPLSLEEAHQNGQSYFEQATIILDSKKTRIAYNSEWLSPMNFADVIKLASKYTVARMLERDDFEKRHRDEIPISVHEFLYPLAQAMDSVALEADVELGGTDQKFNLLVGRDIQREYGQEPQITVMMPILTGTDGTEKMSKSLDNFIGINEDANTMYGKVLSIPDKLITDYFALCTNVANSELEKIRKSLQYASTNPRDVKRRLAREIISIYHSPEASHQAEKEFDRIFINKENPTDIEEFHWKEKGSRVWIIKLLTTIGFAKTNGEARRLIQGGGITIDGKKITDPDVEIEIRNGMIVKAGKLRFVKLLTS